MSPDNLIGWQEKVCIPIGKVYQNAKERYKMCPSSAEEGHCC